MDMGLYDRGLRLERIDVFSKEDQGRNVTWIEVKKLKQKSKKLTYLHYHQVFFLTIALQLYFVHLRQVSLNVSIMHSIVHFA